MQKWKDNLRLGAFVAAVVCMLVGFAGMYNRLSYVFSDPLEDMSHGWLVPIFSLYVLWTQRAELKKDAGAPSFWGLLACLPCLGVALAGSRGLQVRFEEFGFIGLCVTVPWAFYGRRVAKRCVFPALFLLFSVPVATYFDTVTIYLRLVASGTAFVVLRGFGVDVAQVGTAIVSQGAHPFSIDVAEPCSGLRSLVALTALTAAYAWYTQPTWWRRAALFACAVPLAVLGNVVRVLSICFVAVCANSDFALGFYHDYSGYVVFVVAIALMVACGEIITRWCGRRGKVAQQRVPPATGETPVVPVAATGGTPVVPVAVTGGTPVVPVAATGETPVVPVTATGGTPVVPVVFAVVLCPLLLFQLVTPDPVVAEPPKVAWPESIDGYVSDDRSYCQNESCSRAFLSSQIGSVTNCPSCGGALDGVSLGENTVLPKDTIILKRVYTSGSGMQFTVSAVISGAGRCSIHRPELCLPAQGALMSSSTDFEVEGRPYHAIQIDFRQDPPGQLMYTFFNQNGVRTRSHLRRVSLDTWDRSVYNRIDRWVMITVRVASPYGVVMSRPRDRVEVERFLHRIEEVLP